MGNPTSGSADGLLILAAHRYFLLHIDADVDSYFEWVQTHWDLIPAKARMQIVSDTIEAITDALAGSRDIDLLTWQKLAHWTWDQLDVDQQLSIPMGLAWTQISWSFAKVGYRDVARSVGI